MTYIMQLLAQCFCDIDWFSLKLLHKIFTKTSEKY